MINNVGIKINADVSVRNYLTKEDMVKNLFGILVFMNENVINHVKQDNIQTIKIVHVEKN